MFNSSVGRYTWHLVDLDCNIEGEEFYILKYN